MKKIVIYLVLCAVLMAAISCKSTGSTAGAGTTGSVDSGPIISQEEADRAFQDVYNEYLDDLILDGAKNYTVKVGDTLSNIARSQYGSSHGFYFPLIMLASSNVVLDPDRIEPGMNLTVPDLDRNLNDTKARANIKIFLGEVAGIYDRRPNRAEDAGGLRKLADSL